VSGIVIALCCHQLCRYEMYPNTEYLESLQVTKLEFDRICKMSSWAICSVKSQNQKIEQNSEENEDHADNVEEDNDQTK
jgi:tRNA:m4X modification enzyme